MSNKNAILVASFGTSFPETRKATIEAIEKRVAKEFPEYDSFRAFTSEMIINKLKRRDNLEIDNVAAALKRLKGLGYETVVIQPLHLINGTEYHDILRESEPFKEDFKEIKFGSPLFTTHQDYMEVIAALAKQIGPKNEEEAVIFMGHGTVHFSNATYTGLNFMLEDQGLKNVYVGVVEGYPDLDAIKKRLCPKIKKITLMPLMLVAGDHIINDMAGDDEDSWKSILENDGYEVDIYLRGLGENVDIQDIYLQHLKKAISN